MGVRRKKARRHLNVDGRRSCNWYAPMTMLTRTMTDVTCGACKNTTSYKKLKGDAATAGLKTHKRLEGSGATLCGTRTTSGYRTVENDKVTCKRCIRKLPVVMRAPMAEPAPPALTHLACTDDSWPCQATAGRTYTILPSANAPTCRLCLTYWNGGGAQRVAQFCTRNPSKRAPMRHTLQRHEAPSDVNHPAHYGGEDNPFEPIKIIEALGWGEGFNRGNALKYLMRAGKKDPAKEAEDLGKAAWYLRREAERLDKLNSSEN